MKRIQISSGGQATVHLQAIGAFPAKKASEVKIGDLRYYNYGFPHLVKAIESQGRFLIFTVECQETHQIYKEKKLPNTYVAVKSP